MKKIRPLALMAMAAAALSIALAPAAQAAPTSVQTVASQKIGPALQTCTTTNVGSECISPGSAQINDSPPFVDNFPMYGAFPWIL